MKSCIKTRSLNLKLASAGSNTEACRKCVFGFRHGEICNEPHDIDCQPEGTEKDHLYWTIDFGEEY